MPGIFISYRRQDSAGWAGHLTDRLKEQFGAANIFMDIEAIEAGVDFVEAITTAVSSCQVLLAIIGPQWLTLKDPQGRRRLDNPEDFIRLEISAALSRNVRVVPVLVGGAVMPEPDELPEDIRQLTRRQAHELTDSRWDYDVEQLIKTLCKVLGVPYHKDEPQPQPQPPPSPTPPLPAPAKISGPFTIKRVLGGAAILLILAMVGLCSKQQPIPGPSIQTVMPPPPVQPTSMNVAGQWLSPDGRTYLIEQNGNQVRLRVIVNNQVAEVEATGTIAGNVMELRWQSVHGHWGSMVLTVAPDGGTINGSVNNDTIRQSYPLMLRR
ncbi:MAG: toll/interleukin-1 receptor domain-containing protein [Desulfuromonadales bacterium]|nr:MAG: toll/interleukin-1 receptor domain-containing protein [Desulfuromonadales bacterium]